ncbi:MAG TPA: patatin-like phospholipase family protein [Pyrinomonadaceae bacterium]|nr:patatin-like phospholipase family protein [Pyrinomonadaceae bacterium]
MNLLERLEEQTPKRLLALDGNIWRSGLSLGFIKRLEEILRERYKKPDFVLADYFDLIGGTGTGAFFAAELALGKSAAEVERDFCDHLGDFFHKNFYWPLMILQLPSVKTFSRGRLERGLHSVFQDLTLGDHSLRTGLCVITKRVDTGATVPFINHPRSLEFARHKGIRLRDCVQAAMSLPPYHRVKRLDVGRGEVGAFIDGELGMAAVPALYMLLLATLDGFPFRWPAGESNLLVTSIGTGTSPPRMKVESVMKMPVVGWLVRAVNLYWRDVRSLDQLFLQYLSKSRTLWEIDDTIGDMAGELLTPEPALSYLRYDVRLEENEMYDLGLPDLAPKIELLRDSYRRLWSHKVTDNLDVLLKIGEAARKRILPEHFPPSFDPGAPPAPGAADGGAPKHVKPIGKAFISYHFGEAEEAMVDLIRGMVRSHAIPETLDGQMLGGGELRTAVLAMIKEADCLIALLTRDKELKSEGEWTTFDWPRDELNWARDRNMLTVALVEKGVVIKGAYAQYQRIEFTRENFDKALVDLSHTISIWKRKGAN